MLNPIDLTGKTILVTGASSGIGRGVTLRAASMGGKIIFTGRNEERLFELADFLRLDREVVYPFDLKNISGIEELMTKITQKHGKLDGLVHSAGICLLRNLNQSTYDYSHDTFLINFYSFVELVRIFAKKGYNNGGGSIVGISSVDAVKGYCGGAVYSASKGAMNSAVRSLALELVRKNIRVNAVMPGVIRTAIYESYEKKVGEEELLKDTLLRQPLGVGEPYDIADMTVYLLSGAARFITGQCIAVDGGATIG